MTTSLMSKPLKDLRMVGIWEGISYILLLFVAMPLKYKGGIPQAVSVTGTVHGILFILFMYTIYNAMAKGGLGWKKAIIAFVASLIPFGTFFLDKLIFSDNQDQK